MSDSQAVDGTDAVIGRGASSFGVAIARIGVEVATSRIEGFGTVWSTSIAFAGSIHAPGAARRFCMESLAPVIGEWPGSADAVRTAQLIVSELVTNAVNAGSTSVEVSLQLSGDRLKLAVEDDAPDLPVMRGSRLSDDHGRGLPIVDALALSWGYERHGATKAVWGEFTIASAMDIT